MRGEASGAIAYNNAIHPIKENYTNLNYTLLPNGCGTCFAADTEDYPVIMLLNRGLNYFSAVEIATIAAAYTPVAKITTKAYLASHKEVVALIAVIFIILIALVVVIQRMSHLYRKQKRLSEQLEEAKKQADVANASKTAFLFNMSHDIRTPMNAIIGFTNIAKKNLDNKERLLDSLDKTQGASNLLLQLINNILDLSRIESGTTKIEENYGDVYLSFSNIKSIMNELAETRNVKLTFVFGNVQDRYVYADFSRCVRVFVNIITNAIKYSKTDGYVKARCEQTGKVDNYGIYKYTFEDNGIGMSEEFQKHAFDEFTREETQTVSGVQGYGLGLSVCRSFVKAMNGEIELKSKKGVGTTITVTLPFKIQEGETYTDPLTGNIVTNGVEVTKEEADYDFNGKVVLLVEDNELNREIAEDILSEEGIIVETANDGSMAVEMLREKGPRYYDFILMDIQMPIMNGYEATLEIRKMYPYDNIPIIALSANAFAEDKANSIATGMNDHVAKPISIDDLKTILAKHIKK